jgi:hypothetical protein
MTQFEQFPPPRPRSDILSGSLPLLRRGQRSLSIALSNQLTTAKRLSMGNRRDILGRDVHVGHARPEARPAADDVSIQTPFSSTAFVSELEPTRSANEVCGYCLSPRGSGTEWPRCELAKNILAPLEGAIGISKLIVAGCRFGSGRA